MIDISRHFECPPFRPYPVTSSARIGGCIEKLLNRIQPERFVHSGGSDCMSAPSGFSFDENCDYFGKMIEIKLVFVRKIQFICKNSIKPIHLMQIWALFQFFKILLNQKLLIMKDQVFKQNNQNGYGETAYNHVKKKGGILWVENYPFGLKHYYQR